MGIQPGASIGANVRLIGPLSRGGMGSVWRAEHLTLHTDVAVKFVSDALIGDQGFLARFTREAVASARIKSPHAVQIFDHGVTADGVPYIVMELLEGEDLRTRLLRVKKLPLADTAKIITQVARGLSRAHAASIVHRDIKPGNIFLMDQDGELFVKILDFGIAKQVGDVDNQVTMTGQIIGTPHYVSPEQIQRPREADPQSDLWSLAVVAYRCLTGELPFEGESVGAVAIAIDRAAYVRVTAREPALPTMLDAWFAKAFSRAPAARFGSAKELAAAFEAACRDEPLSSVFVDSSPFSLNNTGEKQIVSVAKLAPAAPEITPGAVDLHAPPRPDDRTTRPELPELPGSAAAPAPADGPPKPGTPLSTPLTMGEPTLSHGTVTHIELTNPRRTKLYGGLIAAVAVVGALVVLALSSGDDPVQPAAAPETGAVTAAATAPSAVTAATTATGATSAPTTPDASATAPPTVTTSPPLRPTAPAEPVASTTRPAAAPPAGTSTKTKTGKRGF